MTQATLTTNNLKQHAEKKSMGSIYEIGDRVAFKYFEDEDGEELGYGTIHGRVDDNIAIVKVVLEGRRKKIVDYHEVPFSELMAHIPDRRRQPSEEE